MSHCIEGVYKKMSTLVLSTHHGARDTKRREEIKQIESMMHVSFCSSLLLVAVTLGVSNVLGEDIGSCGLKRSNEFDECFARALMIGRNQTLPKNMSQVNTLCSESRDNLRCIKSFTDTCLTGMQRQSSTLLSTGVRNNVRDFCKGQSGKVKAIRTSRCVRRMNSKLRTLMDNFANDYRAVNLMDDRDKITGLCCGYYKFMSALVNQSSSVCGSSGVENLRKYVDNISGDIMNLFCSNYSNDSPACVAIEDVKKKLANDPEMLEITKVKTATFIPPLLVAVENF